MREINLKVQNNTGIHARPASQLVKLINTFKSDVEIVKDNKAVNGKSIINILSLGIKKNSEITIKATGEDDLLAIIAIKNFITSLSE